MDGRLDDEAWGLADSIDGFTQIDPDNMSAATERTTVQVAYDDRYIIRRGALFLQESGRRGRRARVAATIFPAAIA